MDIKDYLNEIKDIKVLGRDEEQQLWRKFKGEDDFAARQKLIESYQPLVFREAMRFLHNDNVMDIVQEGTVGLIEAAEGYDYTMGAAFSLYAMHRIRGRMINFLAKETKAPLPCIDEVTDDGCCLAECLADTAPSVAETAESHEIAEKLRAALLRLPAKERIVLEDIYLQSREVNAVAKDMEVSASHIYRLQKKGIRRIRGMLAKFMHYWQ